MNRKRCIVLKSQVRVPGLSRMSSRSGNRCVALMWSAGDGLSTLSGSIWKEGGVKNLQYMEVSFTIPVCYFLSRWWTLPSHGRGVKSIVTKVWIPTINDVERDTSGSESDMVTELRRSTLFRFHGFGVYPFGPWLSFASLWELGDYFDTALASIYSWG